VMYKASTLITELLYRKVVGEQLEKLEEAKQPNIIYVTDLVSCSHKYHLRRKYPELTIGFEPSAILGVLLHKGLEDIIGSEGYEVEKSIEKTIEVGSEKYIVKGRVDAYNPESRIVVEVKSSRSTGELPRQHHVEQLNIYLNMLDASQGILIYITPDRILEYSVSREKIELKNMVKNIVNDQTHPRYPWECRYCIFRKICPYYTEEKPATHSSNP